ncbi:MAG: GC-type dockerin domain-anchored protein, partial [Phycisphaerales bacterium JB039]
MASTAAFAQSSIIIQVDKAELRPGETTLVTLLAAFPPHLYAMGGVRTDLLASVGSEGWRDVQLIYPMDGPGTSAGVASPTGITGIIAGQLHFPPKPFTDTSNPLAFWRATYAAPAVVPASFDVEISTKTSEFWVYIEITSTALESHLAGLVEGSGVIHVIGCYADCDGSGALDLFDFLCFQNMFVMGDPYADCDQSGALDLFDFLCFQNEFAAGC